MDKTYKRDSGCTCMRLRDCRRFTSSWSCMRLSAKTIERCFAVTTRLQASYGLSNTGLMLNKDSMLTGLATMHVGIQGKGCL